MTATPAATLCRDHSSGDWIADSDRPWHRLVTLGPGGFPACARLRFIPDPTHPGQSEGDVGSEDAGPELDRITTAVATLLAHTSTPGRGFVAVWDGWGWTPGDRDARLWTPVAERSYFLFEADLSVPWSGRPDPAFVWPADRAWCLTKDVDPHYAGIGASAAAVADLLRAPGLDVVRVDPAGELPSYC